MTHSGPQGERLLQQLEAAGNGFLESISGVSPVQWNYKPGPEIWSVGEIAEHVTVVYRGIQRLLTSGKTPSQPLPPLDQRMSDDQVVRSMSNRSRALVSPEPVRPRGRWATREELTAAFLASQEELLRWLGAVTVDLRQIGGPHLILGPLDGVQWLLFTSAHTGRHTLQVLERKAAPGYPSEWEVRSEK